MPIPENLIRFEAQIASTGRARCKICGFPITKGTFVIKVLGFRINQSLHPECINNMTLALSDYSTKGKYPEGYEPIIRAQSGRIKIGYYKKLGPGKFRFTAIKVIDASKQEGGPSEQSVSEKIDNRTQANT